MRHHFTFDTGAKSLHLEIEKANPYVLTAGSPGRIRRVAPFLEGSEIVESDRGHVTIHGMYKSMPVTAFSTGIGTPSVSATLPEIIEACDDDSMCILRIGTAGALQPELKKGDLCITTDTEIKESTSKTIMGPNYRGAASMNMVDNAYTAAGLQIGFPESSQGDLQGRG